MSASPQGARRPALDFVQLLINGSQKAREKFPYSRIYEAIAFSRDGHSPYPDGMELFFWLPKNQSAKLMYADGRFGVPEIRTEIVPVPVHANPLAQLKERLGSIDLEWRFSLARMIEMEKIDLLIDSECERKRMIERLTWLTTREIRKLNEMEHSLLNWLLFLEEWESKGHLPHHRREEVIFLSMPKELGLLTLPISMTLEKALHLVVKAGFSLPYLSVRLMLPFSPPNGSPLFVFELKSAHGFVCVNTQTEAVYLEDTMLA